VDIFVDKFYWISIKKGGTHPLLYIIIHDSKNEGILQAIKKAFILFFQQKTLDDKRAFAYNKNSALKMRISERVSL